MRFSDNYEIQNFYQKNFRVYISLLMKLDFLQFEFLYLIYY